MKIHNSKFSILSFAIQNLPPKKERTSFYPSLIDQVLWRSSNVEALSERLCQNEVEPSMSSVEFALQQITLPLFCLFTRLSQDETSPKQRKAKIDSEIYGL